MGWMDQRDTTLTFVLVRQEVDESDLALFNKYLPTDQPQRVSLADKILEKIAEHEAQLAGKDSREQEASDLPPKVVEVYTKYAHYHRVRVWGCYCWVVFD